MQKGKKILIITYYWPPSGGVGVQRWMHFAVHLKKLGFELAVYTPSNPQFELKDEQMLDLVAGIRVIKKPIWEPFGVFHALTGHKNKGKVKQGLVLEKSRKTVMDKLIVWLRGNVFIPDPRIFWRRPSVRFLKGLQEREHFEWMVTTGPPHSMHLIGMDLKRQFPSLKWVADFRDPWSDWDVLEKLRTNANTRRKHQEWELEVLQTADLPITVSNSLARQLSENSGVEVQVIFNGVADAEMSEANASAAKSSPFRLGYFGLLNELRNPEGLWQALREWSYSDFEMVFGGTVSESILTELHTDSAFAGKVDYKGYLPQREVFECYETCDLLILLLNHSNNARWILPQKFFEYLKAGVPILALGPAESDLCHLMKDKRIGMYLNGNDVKGICEFLEQVKDRKYNYDRRAASTLIKEFSRERQTEMMAQLLERI